MTHTDTHLWDLSPEEFYREEPVFGSVMKPELELDPREDVWPCETCAELGFDEDCAECWGHRLVHGYRGRGLGYPVTLKGWEADDD